MLRATVVEHFSDELSPSDYRARAAERQKIAKHEVGAAVERVRRDAEGARTWDVVVTDGSEYHHLQVQIPGAGPQDAVPNSLVETAVEEAAGRFAPSARLAGLRDESPLRLSVALPG